MTITPVASSAHDTTLPLTPHSSASPSAGAMIISVAPPATTSVATPRYKKVKILHQSLFGQVQVALDTQRGIEVAIKVSRAELVSKKQQQPGSETNDTSRSASGIVVLEDVRREARILRLLIDDQPPFTMASIDTQTCGLGRPFLNSVLQSPASPSVENDSFERSGNVKQRLLDSCIKGKKHIAGLYDEVEAEDHHYLVYEYMSGGDLFAVLTAQPMHRVNESIARLWFLEMCYSVRYLHAHSIAHLDLSVENICLDHRGRIRLIDFGLAAQHPYYAGDKSTKRLDGSVQRNISSHVRILKDEVSSNGCDCTACSTSIEQLMATDPSIKAIISSKGSLEHMPFLCRPVCEKVHKPGKLGYMCPELYHNYVWCPYSHDIYALGVILYTILTGRAPYTCPDQSDTWFSVMWSGEWLKRQIRQQQAASIYNTLSPNVLHLINMLIKPQQSRPTIDVLLQHPWLHPNHPGNM